MRLVPVAIVLFGLWLPIVAVEASGQDRTATPALPAQTPYVVTPADRDQAPQPLAPPPAAPLTGWSGFQIKKTPAEMADTMRLADVMAPASRTRATDVRLPPQHDVLRLSTGIGYLQGADFGSDIGASGRIKGIQTDVSLFFTAGPMGVQSRSGRVSLLSPGGGWRAEAGDLFSDLAGLARGGRATWSASPNWTPSLSLYLPRSQGDREGTTVVAYRDRLQVLPRLRLGGELTSDGAAFVESRYNQSRFDVTTYYRFTRGLFPGHDKGVAAGFNVGRGVALSGAVRLSDAIGDSTQWQLASLRVPIQLVHQASVTLERTWWIGSSDEGSTTATTFQLPIGPVRISQRLQWGRTDYRQRVVPFGFNRRQSQSSASYNPGAWGSLNYQQSTQWFDDGRMQQWDELAASFKVGRATSVQMVMAVPDVWEPRRLRARMIRQLSPTLQLEAQYGRLSAFQLTREPAREQSRVMLTVRKTWLVKSPSRGGDVRGRTIDQAGRPVAGALVRLGPYSTITDAAGGYHFTRVPDGEFDLALDKGKLPVEYAWDEAPRMLAVNASSRVNNDLHVIPLNAISGHVYIDRNANGVFDAGEGVPSAVVAIGSVVTASTATGAYAFYNQPPGPYTLRLDVKRLAKGLAPVSPAELAVDLLPDKPLGGVDFRLEKRDMPIIMRVIPK